MIDRLIEHNKDRVRNYKAMNFKEYDVKKDMFFGSQETIEESPEEVKSDWPHVKVVQVKSPWKDL